MIAALVLAALLQQPPALTLSEVVDRAVATHPAAAAARALRDRAAAETGEARATRLPRVTLDAAVNRFEEPMVIAPLHGFDVRRPPLFDRTLVQTGLGMSWVAFDFGSRAGHVRAQRLLEEAADWGVSAAEQDVIARSVGAYLGVLSARQLLAAQDQRLAALSAESARVRQLLAQGKAPRVAGLRIDAEERRATADRIAASARLRTAEHELAQVAALPQPSGSISVLPIRLIDTTTTTDTTPALRSRLVARAARTSARLRELEDRAQAAGAGVAALRRTAYPELRFSSAYVDRGRWWGDYSAEWQIGLAVSYSVYGGGRESSIRKAVADERSANSQLRLARMAVETAVDEALGAMHEARARVAALSSAVDQSVEVARIERLALEVGSGTQADFLEAEANLLGARAGLIETRHAEVMARVALARILGELTREWITRTLEHVP
jgi:outer membrane protein